jgi:hypothetical protein
VVKRDIAHDLALVRFEGPPLRALRLGRNADVEEGELHAFTGFPILNALGLHPVTHRGIVSAVSPIIVPLDSGKHIAPETLRKLSLPFDVFQLDAVAYPGNSGSPLYEVDTGRVVGIINSVFVKGTKELALSSPSGISYAIPVDFARRLLDLAGLRTEGAARRPRPPGHPVRRGGDWTAQEQSMSDRARELEVLQVDEAMNRVLVAEREASQAVEASRAQAAAILAAAEGAAEAIARRPSGASAPRTRSPTGRWNGPSPSWPRPDRSGRSRPHPSASPSGARPARRRPRRRARRRADDHLLPLRLCPGARPGPFRGFARR